MKLQMKDRFFMEEEQYIIYDANSFIAEVGGYMGLLLGCSVVSLYNEMEAFLMKFRCLSQTLFKSI